MEYIINSKDYDYFERKRLINTICKKYSFLNMCTIGRSCAGRDIPALRIGAANEYSLIAAAFHGSERITSVVLLMFIERLCEAIAKNGSIAGLDAVKAMQNRGVIFVPCVNPDGCEISLKGAVGCGALSANIGKICKNDYSHWNANLRGVDINHNFNAGWEELRKLERKDGIYGPAPTRFGGYKPESEPETLALTELCRTRHIRHVTALHSQGEVIYWTYGQNHPPKSRRMAQIMATSSGYALDYPTGLAEGGGFKDWFISEFNRPGFTVEMGLGSNPLPAKQAESIYEKIEEMLMLCCIM